MWILHPVEYPRRLRCTITVTRGESHLIKHLRASNLIVSRPLVMKTVKVARIISDRAIKLKNTVGTGCRSALSRRQAIRQASERASGGVKWSGGGRFTGRKKAIHSRRHISRYCFSWTTVPCSSRVEKQRVCRDSSETKGKEMLVGAFVHRSRRDR